MFDNIGGKIKCLAKVICWIGIIASVIYAIILFAAASDSYEAEEALIGAGFAVLILGTLGSWMVSFFMYGFGELIEKINEIVKNTSQIDFFLSNKKSFLASLYDEQDKNISQSEHKWMCSKCGNMTAVDPCECCGYTVNKFSKSEIGNCEMCEKKDVQVLSVKIVDKLGTRYRKVCESCFDKYEKDIVKEGEWSVIK